MQALQDIFEIWNTRDEFAQAMGVPSERARGWERQERIPSEYWKKLQIEALKKGHRLSMEFLDSVMKPPLKRGRPPKKVVPFRRRRVEARA